MHGAKRFGYTQNLKGKYTNEYMFQDGNKLF